MNKKIITYKNWDTYRNIFPEKYWGQGAFDKEIIKFLDSHSINMDTCLDIGGGVMGTSIIKGKFKEHFLLDPYISIYDESWIISNLNWNQNFQFDFIVCRGAFNYLVPNEIKKIKSFLKPNAYFIANTFLQEPTNLKQQHFINGDGQQGIETAYFESGKILHSLDFEEFQIQHEFFYYTQEFISSLFVRNVQFEQYKPNSYMIIFQNN